MELVVATVGRAHGLRGEVALDVRTESPDERLAVGAVLATSPPDVGPLTVARTRTQAGRWYVTFREVADRTAAERLRGVLGEAVSLGEGRTVALVSHGGALQVFLCLALGLSPAAHWQFRLDEASLSELSLYEAGAILSRLNDCHHLEGVER